MSAQHSQGKGQGATTANGQPGYLAYQLRLWQAHDGEAIVWRASLKSAQTRERRSFASLDALFGFLQQQTGASSGSDEGTSLNTDDSLPL
jgi:hypothetical protein